MSLSCTLHKLLGTHLVLPNPTGWIIRPTTAKLYAGNGRHLRCCHSAEATRVQAVIASSYGAGNAGSRANQEPCCQQLFTRTAGLHLCRSSGSAAQGSQLASPKRLVMARLGKLNQDATPPVLNQLPYSLKSYDNKAVQENGKRNWTETAPQYTLSRAHSQAASWCRHGVLWALGAWELVLRAWASMWFPCVCFWPVA